MKEDQTPMTSLEVGKRGSLGDMVFPILGKQPYGAGQFDEKLGKQLIK